VVASFKIIECNGNAIQNDSDTHINR